MKKNQFTKKILLSSLVIAATVAYSAAFAEVYKSQEGLDKIGENLKNAKANQGEYEKNLSTVSKNLEEINKAKSSVTKQKDSVTQEILNNNEALKKVLIQEKEIQQLILVEKQKLETEKKQLEQLEKLMAQIKQNQVQREALLTDYNNQLSLVAEDKKGWKSRETELRAQESKTIQTLRGLATDESQWQSKKKGYEIESKRWSAEVDKQQKISDTYQGLKDK